MKTKGNKENIHQSNKAYSIKIIPLPTESKKKTRNTFQNVRTFLD